MVDITEPDVTGSGLRFVARKEGFVPVAYPDSPGYSVGFGHHGAKPGQTILLPEALDLLRKDLAERATIVAKWLKVPYKPNELDALVSAYLNAGTKMTAVVYFINEGDRDEAMSLLQKFCRRNKAIDQGLAKRRAQEVNIFLDADYGDISGFREYDGIPGPDNFRMTKFPDGFP